MGQHDMDSNAGEDEYEQIERLLSALGKSNETFIVLGMKLA